ncbi:TOPRIM nucleotidyl transferase/hydrolase domain-containing protein [Lysobacter sp. HA18]
MPCIERVVLSNFKRFDRRLDLRLAPDLNVLIGDNEAGKSTILLAIDLVLSASRSRVEHLGIDTLMPVGAVRNFMSGPKEFGRLPEIRVELFLSPGGNFDYNGKGNSERMECDGLKMVCAVSDEHSRQVAELLKDESAPFPFEFYSCVFTTFAEQTYFGARKHVRHLVLDSSRIDSEHATREYTRSLFSAHSQPHERNRLHSAYRQAKKSFEQTHLAELNEKTNGFAFSLRTSSRSNLETDLVIHEGELPVELRGKGRQCQIKADFAMKRGTGDRLDVLLLEEPENHLSHTATRQLVRSLAGGEDRQVVIATHSSFISARLDLRNAQLLSPAGRGVITLAELSSDTASFFMKAPDNSILEFALSERVILVEGDAEFILIEALYEKHSGGTTLSGDRVHVISVGGTSFRRYLELAKLLGVRTAVIRDNDGDPQRHCIDNYADYVDERIQVFTDPDPDRSTFEICLYRDNTSLCEVHLTSPKRRLPIQDYMLANKTDSAFELLKKAGTELVAPAYIKEAIAWVRQ